MLFWSWITAVVCVEMQKKNKQKVKKFRWLALSHLPVIPIKMSSSYLSEVYSVNLVTRIQIVQRLQTDTRLRTDGQMASQIGQRNTEQSPDTERQEEGHLWCWLRQEWARVVAPAVISSQILSYKFFPEQLHSITWSKNSTPCWIMHEWGAWRSRHQNNFKNASICWKEGRLQLAGRCHQ